MKKYREIRLQVTDDVLTELGDYLMLRKMTENDTGIDYEFSMLVFTSMIKGKEAILIENKSKKKKKKK